MDRIIGYIKQYRYVALVLVIGLGLMLLPSGEDNESQPDIQEVSHPEQTLEEKLAQILSQMDGVGKTQVMLTIAAGEETLYEWNEDISTGQETGTSRREVVIVTDESRKEQGLVQQVLPPTYQGAIIVCQGGDSAAVRLAVVEAVSNVTGLTADKITVVKMK